MKKTALAVCILGAFSCAAQAQSQVTIYGIVDVGAYYNAHQYNQDELVGAAAAPQVAKLSNGSVAGLTNGGLSQSRIGFKGTEDLGNGLKATFNLEDRFSPQSGEIANGIGSIANIGTAKAPATSGGDSSLNGQLFNDQANVGLSSDTLGTLQLGRVRTFANDVLAVIDPMKGSLVFSPMGYSGQYIGFGFTEDARLDSTIKYSNKVDAFNYGFLYKFGGQSGQMNGQTAVSLTLGYSAGPLNIQAAYQRNNDAISVGAPSPVAPATAYGQVALTFANTAGTIIGASYQLDNQWKLAGGYQYMTYNTPSNPVSDAAVGNLYGYNVYSTNVTAFANERKQSLAWLGTTYSVTPAFDVTGAFYVAHQNDFSGGACAASSTAATSCSGNNKYFSLVADYKLSKRTDVYAGWMFNQVTGGYDVTGTLHSTDNILATGIRHSF